MKLGTNSPLTSASVANEIRLAKPATASAMNAAATQEDGIRISSEFESLSLLQAGQSTKVARVAAAVQGGVYEVDSVAVGKSIVEHALA